MGENGDFLNNNPLVLYFGSNDNRIGKMLIIKINRLKSTSLNFMPDFGNGIGAGGGGIEIKDITVVVI